MVLLMLLLFTAAASQPDFEKLFKEQLGDILSGSHVVSQKTEYHTTDSERHFHAYKCSGNGTDCQAKQAASLMKRLKQGKVDCDEADDTGTCDEARNLLGDKDRKMSNQEIKTGLAAKAEALGHKKSHDFNLGRRVKGLRGGERRTRILGGRLVNTFWGDLSRVSPGLLL